MARFNLKSFAQPELLKKIKSANLIPLLEPFQMFLTMKEFALPSGADQEIDATALGAILAQPDEDMPGDLVEALHLIGSLGSDERFDELLDMAAANQIETDGEVTALDLATQIWLKNPEALERKEHEEFFQKRKSFESFRAANSEVVIAISDLPTDLASISHRVCPGSPGAGQPEILRGRKPENDIHVRNVYYAERPADQPWASEHAGRMSFVCVKTIIRLAHRASEILQLTVETQAVPAIQRVTSRSGAPSPEWRLRGQTTRRAGNR